MSNLAPGIASNCIQYIVNLDENGDPILGTMRGKPNNYHIDKGYGCREAILPKTQMRVPSGHVPCYRVGHKRYFYKVSVKTGNILPNSLFVHIGKPQTMCTGTYNILEYIPWI